MKHKSDDTKGIMKVLSYLPKYFPAYCLLIDITLAIVVLRLKHTMSEVTLVVVLVSMCVVLFAGIAVAILMELRRLKSRDKSSSAGPPTRHSAI